MWAGSQMTMQYGTNVNYEMLRTAPPPARSCGFRSSGNGSLRGATPFWEGDLRRKREKRARSFLIPGHVWLRSCSHIPKKTHINIKMIT